MTENQKNTEDGWVMLNAKVPPHIGKLFNLLARQRGMTSYELLQLLINGFITAAKHEGPLTPELRLLIDSLKLDVAFSKAFNFASPTATAEIAQMILILQQPGRKGFGLMMIDRPFMGDAAVTHCVDTILERVTEVGMADLYKELRQIGVKLDSQSVRETLVLMCDAQQISILNGEDADEMPGMGNFHDFGKQVEYGKRYKRKPRRTPDSLANSQQRIVFGEEDQEQAAHEAGFEYEGFKPFDVEP
jgi:hypothetical protein